MKHTILTIMFLFVVGPGAGCTSSVESSTIETHHGGTAVAVTKAAAKKALVDGQEELETNSYTRSGPELIDRLESASSKLLLEGDGDGRPSKQGEPVARDQSLDDAGPDHGSSHPEKRPTVSPEKSPIISSPLSRQESDGARGHAGGATTASDAQRDETNVSTKVTTREVGSRHADVLIGQAGRLGREAQTERSLKKGRRALKLLHQATTVAPDYRRSWEVYRQGLAILQSRFGHSLVMHDSEIDRELRRCHLALVRLH